MEHNGIMSPHTRNSLSVYDSLQRHTIARSRYCMPRVHSTTRLSHENNDAVQQATSPHHQLMRLQRVFASHVRDAFAAEQSTALSRRRAQHSYNRHVQPRILMFAF